MNWEEVSRAPFRGVNERTNMQTIKITIDYLKLLGINSRSFFCVKGRFEIQYHFSKNNKCVVSRAL
jgi:hypothetical protein